MFFVMWEIDSSEAEWTPLNTGWTKFDTLAKAESFAEGLKKDKGKAVIIEGEIVKEETW